MSIERKQGGKESFLPAGKVFDLEGTVNVKGAHAGMGVARVALIAATVTDAGAVLAWANPFSVPLILFRPVIRLTSEATGAATVDGGVAADGVTSSDNLWDGLDVGAAAGLFEAGSGTNGLPVVELGATEFVTITASATLAGLVGNVHIPYMVA